MMGAQRGTAAALDTQLDRVADLEAAVGHPAAVHVQIAQLLLGVVHLHLAAVGAERSTAVALLAAGLAVERRLVGHQHDLLAQDPIGARLLHLLAVDPPVPDLATGLPRVVAQTPAGTTP